jgi:predicted Zn-dependent protease with MMP-like domain
VARPPRLTKAAFETLVEKAITELPEEFRSRIENVVIAVEDEPTDEDYALTDTPDNEDLFGIYRGAMRTEMTWDALPGLPPQVVVFRGPILRNTDTSREAVREIRDTIIHELGHYFGLEDDEMPY